MSELRRSEVVMVNGSGGWWGGPQEVVVEFRGAGPLYRGRAKIVDVRIEDPSSECAWMRPRSTPADILRAEARLLLAQTRGGSPLIVEGRDVIERALRAVAR